MEIVAKYIGANGEHYMGVPDRDLTTDDWSRMGDDQRRQVEMSQFYEMQGEHGEPVLKPQGDITNDPQVVEMLRVADPLDQDAPGDSADEPKKEGKSKR